MDATGQGASTIPVGCQHSCPGAHREFPCADLEGKHWARAREAPHSRSRSLAAGTGERMWHKPCQGDPSQEDALIRQLSLALDPGGTTWPLLSPSPAVWDHGGFAKGGSPHAPGAVCQVSLREQRNPRVSFNLSIYDKSCCRREERWCLLFNWAPGNALGCAGRGLGGCGEGQAPPMMPGQHPR